MTALPFNHPAWVEVNLAQFKQNIKIIKNFIGPNKKFCLPIKANAYGHGLVNIAHAACEEGIDYLGVACLQEGKLLRAANIQVPILVFGAIHIEQVPDLIAHDLEFTIASHYKARMVAEACKQLDKTVKVHLELDTGMQRTGVRPSTAPSVLDFMAEQECFEIKGIYSHFATADDLEHPFAQTQIAVFRDFVQQHRFLDNPHVICHLANSAGVAAFPESHFDMVRPGGLVFGCLPFARDLMPEALRAIQPCMAIKAKVAYYKNVPGGTGIGYSHTYISKQQSNILTIPLGYGDGLRRSLSNKGQILHNGKRYPIVGNICMDQFMVDCGADPGYVGDVVTLIGKDNDQEITIEEMSQLCATHPYEILCGFNDRLPRLYKYTI
ncbi:MAG TPA: alanine racemase [Gammaproteobacteria bacterium]|nr:alanine racemase [Gammaproteobacteria bacterium]